jgi:hypothetical protein
MTYVLAPNNVVLKYPYSAAHLRIDNPGTSFSAAPPDSLLAEWNVFPVIPSTPPVPALDQNVVEGAPLRIDGVWTQQWVLVNASAEEIARRTEMAAQSGELDAAKLDAWVVQFLAMTPSGAQDFVNNNSATLAALRPHVARLAYVVRVLVRREFHR